MSSENLCSTCNEECVVQEKVRYLLAQFGVYWHELIVKECSRYPKPKETKNKNDNTSP
jgi:predicted metal-binding protein